MEINNNLAFYFKRKKKYELLTTIEKSNILQQLEDMLFGYGDLHTAKTTVYTNLY